MPKGGYMKLSERAKGIIRLLLPILLGAMLTVTAVLFILSACSINSMGESPYTYGSVGAAFSKIAAVVYITIALTVVTGAVLLFLAPDGKKRAKPPRDVLSRLKRAYRTADLSTAGERLRKKIRFEQTLRRSLRLANFSLLAIGLVITLCCAINADNYAEGVTSHELTASVLNVVIAAVIYLTPAALVALLRMPIDSLSAEYELKLVEKLPRRRAAMPESAERKAPYLLAVRLSVIAICAVLIILGIFNGGMNDVLQKAIKICTECIGLG